MATTMLLPALPRAVLYFFVFPVAAEQDGEMVDAFRLKDGGMADGGNGGKGCRRELLML